MLVGDPEGHRLRFASDGSADHPRLDVESG
jgi:hypothetical protein